MKHLTIVAILLAATSLVAQDKWSNLVYSQGDLKVFEFPESDEFENATIELNFLKNKEGSDDMLATFEIKNYELKASSNNNLTGLCANSGDGQHIHFIVDGQPYRALYENKITWDEKQGQHTLLAFLSRSHHQSIKTPTAFVYTQFATLEKPKKMDLSKPTMIYSRPKGTYVDGDTKEIMLDFYMLNADLSPDGYKIRVEIDNSHDFIVTKWTPYLIQGLTMGEHKIKMTLLDKNNKVVKTMYNPVERDFILMQNP